MREIEQTTAFKRDLKRESRGEHRKFISEHFTRIVTALANDEPLTAKYRDHALVGEWQDCRDCHIRPDLVLIYRKPNDSVLQLVRFGSHSELSL